MLPSIEIPELFFGLVARMGVDVQGIVDAIRHEFAPYGYDVHVIKITELLDEFRLAADLPNTPIDARIRTRIDACNQARRESGCNELFGFLSILSVQSHRKKETNSPYDPRSKKNGICF